MGKNQESTDITNSVKSDSNLSLGYEKPVEKVVDYEDCFEGINGCAVFYSTYKNEYTFYNQEMCNKQVSPCSTFKIISAQR